MATNYDVGIVGGGPAGLSAGLVLGRCRRSVLIIDSQQYRNAVTQALHGFVTRDGMAPQEFLRIGREQLQPYDVTLVVAEVADAIKIEGRFELTTTKGEVMRCRKLLLATGIIDNLPEVKGVIELYGKSAFHCPYCDGWENRDKRIVLYAQGKDVLSFALTMRPYTEDLILCTNGPAELNAQQRAQLSRNNISLIEKPVDRFEGNGGQLTSIVFKDTEIIERDCLFFHLGQRQRSSLAPRLGVETSNEDGVQAEDTTATNIDGLFVAGDATRDVQQLIVAAAEGCKAAFEINTALRDEDYR